MEVRDFQMGNEQEISDLIRRTLVEVNSVDCPKWEIDYLYEAYSPERVVQNARDGHTYVLWEDEKIIGTGTIGRTGEKESEIFAAFLLPEYIGKGYGRKLFDLLESDPLFVQADRVWLTASITALKFYEKIGYAYEGGYCHLNEENLIVMEKFPGKE